MPPETGRGGQVFCLGIMLVVEGLAFIPAGIRMLCFSSCRVHGAVYEGVCVFIVAAIAIGRAVPAQPVCAHVLRFVSFVSSHVSLHCVRAARACSHVYNDQASLC